MYLIPRGDVRVRDIQQHAPVFIKNPSYNQEALS